MSLPQWGHTMTDKLANTMWGGRFAAGPDSVMEAINASIGFDQRLASQDIKGSRAHAAMLGATGIICNKDMEIIREGLLTILSEIDSGTFPFSTVLEDIHMNVESRLKDLIGEPAGRLHTGRSRNDQVATDFKLWVRSQLDHAEEALISLIDAFLDQAEAGADWVMPGFTHLQTAQPITWGHHMMAYVEMFGRDLSRVRDARARMNESPLGAAALAGTSFPIDRHMTAEALGFDRPAANSLDAVSDRDFALDFLSTASICAMKGLPLAYSKDMQEDKEQVFDAADNWMLALAAMDGMIRDMTANRDSLSAAAASGFSTATDLADWLVRILNLPFREAHHVTGSLVAMAESFECDLSDLTLDQMKSVHGDITNKVFEVLGVKNSAASRTSYGGTAPSQVRAQVARWRKVLS
jgi:argininosuccinate lyase